MSNSVVMTFGSYNFSPVPSLTFSRNAERTPGLDFCLSTPLEIELNGFILPTGTKGFGPVSSGIKEISDAFKCGSCNTFQLRCNSEPYVFNGPAKVTNFNIQPRTDGDLYVNSAAYTITLEMMSMTGNVYDNQPSGISSISEDWNFEILDETVGGSTSGPKTGTITVDAAYQVSHNVTVSAPYLCTGDNPIGWERASIYITNEIATDTPENGITGLFLPQGLTAYNHFRVVNKNPHEGTISLNETWILASDTALEDFDVQIEESLDSYLTTVSINGNIQGLAGVNYPSASGTTKIENAITKWNNISGDIFGRAQTVYLDTDYIDQDSNPMPLNYKPLSNSFGYNNKAGTIVYSYTYNNRPANCVSDAKLENINFTENNPNDIFASLTILGRQQGQLLQDMNTFGPKTREISIEAILPPWGSGRCANISTLGAGTPTDYDSLVSGYETYLTGTYDQVFVNNDTKTWNPKDGRFTYVKSWTIGGCS